MLWIVGKNFSEFDAYLTERGIEFGIFADSARTHGNTHASQVVSVDLTSKDLLIDSLPADLNVSSLVVAGYEQYVLPSAWLAAHYGVPGLTESGALRATDKILMHEAFCTYDSALTPDFSAVTSEDDLRSFAETHQFPLMLKPSNLMKSMYVSKNNSLDELIASYKQLSAATAKRLAVAAPTRILVEEYMPGTMHTAAGFVDSNGAITLLPVVVDCVMARDLDYEDNFIAERRIPSELRRPDQEKILEVARKGAEALDLRNTALHIELILTPNGPKIIEIGARLGGYRARMYAYSYGVDLYDLLLEIVHGRTIHNQTAFVKNCSVIEIFPKENGKLEELRGLTEAVDLPGVIFAKQKRFSGQAVGKASDGYRATAVIMLGGESEKVLNNTRRQIYRILQPQVTTLLA
jgi:phosphoribosylamine-glycine ligase